MIRRCLRLALALVSGFAWGCEPRTEDPRPSFLLVVLDTVRADAVSALGDVADSTPYLDGLAASGLLFTRAYSAAPWTVPSHASLFTGLRIDQHGVGVAGRILTPLEMETLAESLSGAGYETTGFSENPLVSAPFQLTQGFDHFAARSVSQLIAETHETDPWGFLLRGVERWARSRQDRSAGAPFFLFVNILDAHEPYTVRESNPFLPVGVGAEQARGVRQSTSRICDAIPPPDELAILKGLYRGDVAAADRKLAALHQLLERAGLGGNLVTIVTSDHGEHLGEDRLLDHQFSLHNALLHVPLVVHGAPGASAARIEAPVSLLDIAPSVLAWAGVKPPAALAGLPLPVQAVDAADDVQEARALIAAYGGDKPIDWPEQVRVDTVEKRRRCGPSDRVFGDMASLTRYPLKLIWYRNYPPRLFDLSWDPRERSDLRTQQPEVAKRLEAELHGHLEATGLFETVPGAPVASPEAIERLRSLGYSE